MDTNLMLKTLDHIKVFEDGDAPGGILGRDGD
jgi:hypothetical protein